MVYATLSVTLLGYVVAAYLSLVKQSEDLMWGVSEYINESNMNGPNTTDDLSIEISLKMIRQKHDWVFNSVG